MVECPHCHMRVMPMSDDRCPSCDNDTTKVPTGHEDLKRVTLWEYEQLPGFCIDCGKSTTARQRVVVREESRSRTNAVVSGFLALFVSPLLGLLSMLGGAKKRNARHVTLRVPWCKHCDDGGKLEPLHVDWDESAMDFVVHKRFVRKLRRKRREAKAS